MRVGLRLGLGLGWRAVAVMVGLQLLELIRREDRGELLVGLLVDRFHLLLHGCVGDRVVIGQRGNLIVAIGEDGSSFAV